MPEAQSHPPVKCGGCTEEIESCVGAHGDWMHSATRRERCEFGGFAWPQTPLEVDRLRRAS